jgi:hypothetical protein
MGGGAGTVCYGWIRTRIEHPNAGQISSAGRAVCIMASTSACTVAGGLGEDRLHEEGICMLQSSDVVVTGGRVRAPRP